MLASPEIELNTFRLICQCSAGPPVNINNVDNHVATPYPNVMNGYQRGKRLISGRIALHFPLVCK